MPLFRGSARTSLRASVTEPQRPARAQHREPVCPAGRDARGSDFDRAPGSCRSQRVPMALGSSGWPSGRQWQRPAGEPGPRPAARIRIQRDHQPPCPTARVDVDMDGGDIARESSSERERSRPAAPILTHRGSNGALAKQNPAVTRRDRRRSRHGRRCAAARSQRFPRHLVPGGFQSGASKRPGGTCERGSRSPDGYPQGQGDHGSKTCPPDATGSFMSRTSASYDRRPMKSAGHGS